MKVLPSLKWLLILPLILTGELHSQENQALGDWKSHLPHQNGKAVTQSESHIIYATDWSLIFIDKTDLSASFLSKVNGLSDIGIMDITYDEFNDQLFVLYTNSNIDIVSDAGVINIPNIKFNTDISGDRQLYTIHFERQDRAYLGTGFGIVAFDPQSYNFGSTTFTGIPVKHVTTTPSMIYAGTEEGVYAAQNDESVNLGDFNQWVLLNNTSGLPELYNVSALATGQNALYIGTENTIYYSSDGLQFNEVYISDEPFGIQFINSDSPGFIAGFSDGVNTSQVVFFDEAMQVQFTAHPNCINLVRDVIKDEDGRVWYADLRREIRYSEDIQGSCRRLSYNSPFSQRVSDIAVGGGKVLVASGGVSESFLYLFSRQGFYLLEEGNWENTNEFVTPGFAQNDLLSIFRAAIHPTQDKIYLGSYWAGLYEENRESGESVIYNKTNSSLRGAVGDEQRERVTGMAFDQYENLWVTTYGARSPLNVFTAEGNWASFDVSSPNELTDIVIDQLGYLWIPVFGNSGGVLVVDVGENSTSPVDDRQRFLNSSNSELTTNLVNGVAVDIDGSVWVGTSEGPVIFDCGIDAFDESCRGVRRKVLEDNIPAFLLADQDIRAISVDGANRKWFGTRNGVFVQSADGEESVARFTEENSPLFDNSITSMAFEGESGIMYIGTEKGLMAFRTNTTAGSERHKKSEVYAFPNPVEPGYTGTIAIKGLVRDALVKITDINGNLVYETRALGGQAIWDGNNANGTRAASGIYLVFSSETDTFDTPNSFVTKIMVLH